MQSLKIDDSCIHNEQTNKKSEPFKSRFIVIIESENINKIKPITIETMQWTRTHTFRCFYFVSVCRFVWRQKCSSVYVSTHFAGKCKRFHTNTCKHQQCIGIRHTHTHACVHGVHSIQSNAFGLRLEEGWVEDKQKQRQSFENEKPTVFSASLFCTWHRIGSFGSSWLTRTPKHTQTERISIWMPAKKKKRKSNRKYPTRTQSMLDVLLISFRREKCYLRIYWHQTTIDFKQNTHKTQTNR